MAGLDKGITIRPSANALLTIDSEDRFKTYAEKRDVLFDNPGEYNTPYNFQIGGERVLLAGFMTRIGVTEINFPWVIPNINLKTNKMLVSLTNLGVPVFTDVLLTINVGFYTPSQLAAQIQADIRALDPLLAAFTFTYGTNLATNSPVFDYGTGNPNLEIELKPVPYNSVSYPFGNNCRQLFDLLGFSSQSVSFATFGYGGYTFAQGTRYVDIVCRQLTGRQGLADGTSQQIGYDALCRVYIGASTTNTINCGDPDFAPPGTTPFTIHRMYPVPKMMNWDARTNIGTSLKFEVYDDEGDLLDKSVTVYNESMDWSMSLLASEN